MGDEEDRKAEPRLEVENFLQDLSLHDDVERGGRLVHDDQLRIERQRDGEHDALTHAAGKLVRVVVEPCRLDADHREELGGARPRALRDWSRYAGRSRREIARRSSPPGSANSWRSGRQWRLFANARRRAASDRRRECPRRRSRSCPPRCAPAGGADASARKRPCFCRSRIRPQRPTISPSAMSRLKRSTAVKAPDRRPVFDLEITHLDEIGRHLRRLRRGRAQRRAAAAPGRGAKRAQRPDRADWKSRRHRN